MDHERSSSHDTDKLDEVILPGFRFHPTDEELVGFYLKRKIQQRPLSIELIKQLDIYKYDPWDLPKLASTGEKEWYFYCPRDRKYRNSARPNRVTGAGFWKATGTDRPIYASEGTTCIGLKKSLVFYKGRAAKGVKTDWMMHEFRLPSLADHSVSTKRLDKSFPANDSWAICRIFKKTNSTAQRTLSHSWVSPLPEPNSSDMLLSKGTNNSSQFSSETISNMSQLIPKTSTTSSANHFCSTNNIDLQDSSPNSSSSTTTPPTNLSPMDFVPYKFPYHNPINLLSTEYFSPNNLLFPPLENPPKLSVDNITPSILLNMSSIIGNNNHFGNSSSGISSQDQCNSNGFSNALPFDVPPGNLGSICTHDHHHHHQNLMMIKNHIPSANVTTSSDHSSEDHEWEVAVRSLGFPLNLPLPLSTAVADPWKPSMIWDSNLPCPTEIFTNFYSNKCYT